MGTFKVDVSVVEFAPRVWHININPETVLLDGQKTSTIIWTMIPGPATFDSAGDVQFSTPSGQSQFNVTLNSPTQISATINRFEENQTIYTYFLTVHLTEAQVAIRVDPEVDNPPPPPGP